LSSLTIITELSATRVRTEKSDQRARHHREQTGIIAYVTRQAARDMSRPSFLGFISLRSSPATVATLCPADHLSPLPTPYLTPLQSYRGGLADPIIALRWTLCFCMWYYAIKLPIFPAGTASPHLQNSVSGQKNALSCDGETDSGSVISEEQR